MAFNIATQTANKNSFPTEESEERSVDANTLVPTPDVFKRTESQNDDYVSRNSNLGVKVISSSVNLVEEKRGRHAVRDVRAERTKKKEITNMLKNLRTKSSTKTERATFWNKYLVNDYVIRQNGEDKKSEKPKSTRVEDQSPGVKLYGKVSRNDFNTARASYIDYLEQKKASKSSREGDVRDQSIESGTTNER